MGMDSRSRPPDTVVPAQPETAVVTVADFDGALISRNSFSMWVKYVGIRALTSFRLRLFVSILALTCERKVLKRIRHDEFKRQIDALPYPETWGRQFALSLRSCLRLDVVEKLMEVSSAKVLIATAAPSCYAVWLPELLPIAVDDVIYSYWAGATYVDNRGVTKRDRICSRLSAFEGRLGGFIFFTDHEDDLPTARASLKTYLCHPTGSARAAFASLGDRLEIMG